MKKLQITILSLFLVIIFSFPGIAMASNSCRWVSISSTWTGTANGCKDTESVAMDSRCYSPIPKNSECCCPIPLKSAESYTPAPTKKTSQEYKSLIFYPQVRIPGSKTFNKASTTVGYYTAKTGIMTSDLLAKYIKALYNYGLMIGGILAAIVLMGGGVLWLVSAGNDSKITQAKELITGSIVGLVILFSSYLLLATINPNLIKMRPIETKIIEPSNLVCCEYYKNPSNSTGKTAEMMGSVNCKLKKGKIFSNRTELGGGRRYFFADQSSNTCVTSGCCVLGSSEIISCIPTINSYCTSFYQYYGKNKLRGNNYFFRFYNNSCSEVPSQLLGSGKTTSCNASLCKNSADGKKCFFYNNIDSGDGQSFCYNHICLIGLGKEGDPCGNNGGSTCQKKNSSLSTDLGGRRCRTDLGLKCYKKPK